MQDSERELSKYMPKDPKYERISISDSKTDGVDPEIGEY